MYWLGVSRPVTLEHLKSVGKVPSDDDILVAKSYNESTFHQKFAEAIIEDCIRWYTECPTKDNAITAIDHHYGTNFS